MTILAVDDSTESLIAIKAILGDVYDLCVAKSAKSALKAMERSNIDLILMDVQMPETSGFELIAELEKWDAYKNIPVIFLTGTITDDIVSEIDKTSAKGFIEKPIDSRLLKEKIAFFSAQQKPNGE
ncbi:MAG: response regulator [Treponema sp.]|nr:response regulator [Treponema sp.]